MLVAGAVAASCLLVLVPTPADTDGSSVNIASADTATDPNAPLVPGLAVRTEDKGGMYDCFAPSNGPLQRCEYGDSTSDVRIALIGDSHAAHLIPGLASMAEARGWSLSTFVGMRCDEGPAELCAGAPATIDALLAEDFDLVLAGGYRASDSPVENVESYWSSLVEQGVRLVPVVDVPLIPESVYACLDASGGDPLVANRCEISFADGLEAFPDRATLLAERLGLPTIDVTHRLCTDEACQAVVGNTVVYQDSPSSHLTATFSRALADEFGDQIEGLLRQSS